MSQDGAKSEACIVCGDEFDNEDHQPVALPACGHTFCRECILKLDRTKRILRCPECRQPHDGEAPANLPVNHQLLNYIVNQSQGDNRCVKTDGSCSRQVGGARKKHFPKKIVKSRKESNVKSNSCASRKEDGDESDQGKSSSNKEVNSDNDSGKGSGLESESDDEDFRKRMDDEDLSSGKEDSDDSASPQRKKKETGAKRREHDGEQECSDIDNDSPVDGSRTKRNDNTSHPLLLNNQKVIDIEILQPQIKEPQCCYQSLFRTKKNLKIAFGIAAVLTLLFCMGIMPLIACKILDVLGFTSEGVKKDSYAASWQSQIQKICNSSKNWYKRLQYRIGSWYFIWGISSISPNCMLFVLLLQEIIKEIYGKWGPYTVGYRRESHSLRLWYGEQLQKVFPLITMELCLIWSLQLVNCLLI